MEKGDTEDGYGGDVKREMEIVMDGRKGGSDSPDWMGERRGSA